VKDRSSSSSSFDSAWGGREGVVGEGWWVRVVGEGSEVVRCGGGEVWEGDGGEGQGEGGDKHGDMV
jgi:hypothetical protein